MAIRDDFSDNLTVTDRDVPPSTPIAGQLPPVAERRIYPGGYYAASGRLSTGDLIEMWIVEERQSGQESMPSYVYLALNGRCNRRRYGLDGGTGDLADWLRGRHTGSNRPVTDLGRAGRRILSGLYADCGA